MDDLELLRDLGRELEHEPPGTLVRQRRRLLDAAGGRRRLRLPGRWTLLGAVAAVTAAAILVPALLLHGRDARQVTQNLTGPASRTLNILVVGSDSRAAEQAKAKAQGREVLARSDTMVLLHVPADRKSVRAVSIPRDSMVDVPACEGPDGKLYPARRDRINVAFSVGGVSCALKAVEAATNVRIDNAIVIDFNGFREMVDALGGVEFMIPRAIEDPAGRVLVPPGRQLLRGEGALAFVRARHGLDDGSDLARIRRQQQFMAAMLRKAKDMQMKSPLRFAKFLAVAADSMKTYPSLDLGTLEGLARSMRGTGADAVTFATVPVRPAPEDPNRVVWETAQAKRLFAPFRKKD